MVRDKAAEAAAERSEKNEALVKFIVEQKGAEDTLQAVVSGEKQPHFEFTQKWVPILFDDQQLDRIVKYLTGFLHNCEKVSDEVSTMSYDKIKYILVVMLPEVSQ
ncbi:PWWP domain-containing DNA repair factor 3B-like [Melanotaenia boesemani]|uniref:PWWP domain-containing DNA repair factor 3B-like n=1 Tax=Melanotaenia boesemani TaxID=1250792 RepID=UPI001C055D9E|nr:PWWP domain-containing DNA repair factor 3B-like [Melanotaenia boesemani]